MGAESDVRLGEAAIQHGIVSIDTLRLALNALLLERSGGLDRSLAHYLYESGSITEAQFRLLVQFDPSAATIPLPKPAQPKPPPPRVGPPPLTKDPPPRRPAPMPDTQRSSNQPFRPRRAIPSLVPGRVLTIVFGLAAAAFGVWLARSSDDGSVAQKDLLAGFDRSVQSARDAYAGGDGRGAIEGYRAAVGLADRCIADARDHRWDSSRVRQQREEMSSLVERLEAADEQVSAARRAFEEANTLVSNGRTAEAWPRLDEALSTIVKYEGTNPSDDPFRKTMRLLRDSIEKWRAEAQAAPAPPVATAPAVDAGYQRARDAYFDLGQRIAEALDASTAKTFAAEAARVRALLTETQKGMAADDSHRAEIDSWLDSMDTWDRRIAATAGAPPRVSARDEQYEQVRRDIDAALTIKVGWDARCGREEVEAKLVKWTLRADLAVLKLPAGEYTAIRLAAGSTESGEPTVAFGCPAGGGAIEGMEGRLGDAGLTVGTERRLMDTTLGLDAFGSGGVLLDGMRLTAVGVALSAPEGPLAGHTYAIPASVVRKEFPSLWNGTGYGAAVGAPDRGTGVGLPDTCRECRGKGATCSTCNGKGQVKANCSKCCGQGFWEDSYLRHHTCTKCNGACTFDLQCPTCGGSGNVECRKCGAGGK